MPQVKIDFYRVDLPDDHDGPFQDLLQQLIGLPPEQRSLAVQGGWVHFKALTMSRTHALGQMFRVRADQIPSAVDLAGEIEQLALADDQGIAWPTHFYYRLPNRTLLLLRGPQAVHGPSFEDFISRKSEVAISLAPVPQPEVVRRLRRMQDVKKVQLQLADADAFQHFRQGRAIVSLVDIMNHYDAPMAELTLSIGRRRTTRLNRQRAVSLCEQLLRMSTDGQRVGKARIIGWDPDDERTVLLDLLHGKMVESAEVLLENRQLSYAGCVGALEAAYERRRNDLAELYSE